MHIPTTAPHATEMKIKLKGVNQLANLEILFEILVAMKLSIILNNYDFDICLFCLENQHIHQ